MPSAASAQFLILLVIARWLGPRRDTLLVFVVFVVFETVELWLHGRVQDADDQDAAIVLAPEEHHVRRVRTAQVGAAIGAVEDRILVEVLTERLQSVHVSLSLDLAPTIERIARDGIEIVLCALLVSDARHRLPRWGEAMTRSNAIKHAVLSKAAAFAVFERGVEGLHLGVVEFLALAQGFDPGLDHVFDAGKPASGNLRLGEAREMVG